MKGRTDSERTTLTLLNVLHVTYTWSFPKCTYGSFQKTSFITHISFIISLSSTFTSYVPFEHKDWMRSVNDTVPSYLLLRWKETGRHHLPIIWVRGGVFDEEINFKIILNLRNSTIITTRIHQHFSYLLSIQST
jgi:hypothetical protein